MRPMLAEAPRDWSSTYELEAELTDAVTRYLALRDDVMLKRVEAGGSHRRKLTTRGTADFVGLVQPHGRHIEIECKARTGRSSPDQLAREIKVRRLGGVYEVCRSVRDVHAAIEKAKVVK